MYKHHKLSIICIFKHPPDTHTERDWRTRKRKIGRENGDQRENVVQNNRFAATHIVHIVIYAFTLLPQVNFRLIRYICIQDS